MKYIQSASLGRSDNPDSTRRFYLKDNQARNRIDWLSEEINRLNNRLDMHEQLLRGLARPVRDAGGEGTDLVCMTQEQFDELVRRKDMKQLQSEGYMFAYAHRLPPPDGINGALWIKADIQVPVYVKFKGDINMKDLLEAVAENGG